MRRIKVFIFVCLGVVLITHYAFAEATPEFSMHVLGETDFDVVDGDVISGDLYVKNFDDHRWVDMEFYGFIDNDRVDWLSFTPSELTVSPLEEVETSFDINVPAGVCEKDYSVLIVFRLTAYYDEDPAGEDVAGASMSTAIGERLNFYVDSGISCDPSENVRVVFHDKDGDGLWEPSSGESKIELGTVGLYGRWTDLLVLATDLSTSTGQFNVPGTVLGALRNFYVTTSLGKYDTETPTELDKTWEGNLYVDRNGTDSVIASAIQINNISDYSQISSLVPMRSRNTDQTGVWESGTISIGPDDKDQIISPIHWDYETAGTDFEYADLDYDGRIDPDDKDHIISPLYWDFPN